MPKENTEKINHKNIFAALSALQAEMQSVERSKEVKFTVSGGREIHYWYAPLDKIMDFLYPLLGKHGLSVRHELSEKGVECVVSHETAGILEAKTNNEEKTQSAVLSHGEIRSGILTIKTSGDMKDVGGQITYARRYTLAMVLGITTDEDTDITIEESRKENLEKFALKQSKEKIAQVKTEKELKEIVNFFNAEVNLISGKKTPKLGLAQEQYDELLTLCVEKGIELKSDK